MKDLNSGCIIEFGSLGLFRCSLAVFDAVLEIVLGFRGTYPSFIKKSTYIPDPHLRHADLGSEKLTRSQLHVLSLNSSHGYVKRECYMYGTLC